MDAIINQAMAGHIHAFVERLRLVASRYEDSVERFWAVVNDYVVCFDELPNAATLWLEYWIDSVRRQRVVALQRTVEPISILLVELLEALPVRARPEAAHALLSYLLGTVLQQRVRQVPFGSAGFDPASASRQFARSAAQ